jgi:phosphohistidine phosphatase SixA
MTEVAYLLRHGDYERDYRGERLTQLGREQSQQARDDLVARKLGGRAYLLSSDAPRALETAAIIGEGLRVDVLPSPRVRRAGEFASKVIGSLGKFLSESLTIDAGIDAEPNTSFVVVTHAPLIAQIVQQPVPNKIEKGRIFEIFTDWHDLDYDEETSELVLNGGLER